MAKTKAKESDAGRILTRDESVLRGNKWRQKMWFERADELFFDTDIAGQRKQKMLDEMSARRAKERLERRKAAEERAKEEQEAAADALRAAANEKANQLQKAREDALAYAKQLDEQIKDYRSVAAAGK